MTMLITKFNKLIANKFVWIGFTFLIVLAFVVWDMSIPDDARDPARQAAGTLHGKPVMPDELRHAYVHTYMGIVLSVGQSIPIDTELDEELTRMAWRRLASLRKGEVLGLQASNKEVVAAIRNYPGFNQQGQFNSDVYRSFVQQYLGAMGFSAGQFEEHVRQELVLQKLQRMVAESILIAPSEIERAIHLYGDEFTIEYVKVDEDALGTGLEVTEEEGRAFFDENAEAFTIPPKVQVKYVRFPIDSFLDDVEVTEAQAMDYYDLNIEDFVQAEETALPDGEDESIADEDLFQVTTTLPFEEVKDTIVDRLTREQAARRAADAAMDFVITLVPDRQGLAATFEEAASSVGLDIVKTEPFVRGEIPEGIDAGNEFSLAAFELRPNPEYYFSDAVEGEDHIYVLALEERIPQRVPEFEEVADLVREAAQRQAVADALRDLADTFKEAAETGLRDGQSFAETAGDFVLTVNDPLTFTVASSLTNAVYAEELVRAVLAHNEGEVTDPFPVEDGHLVVHVARRVPADQAQYRDFRPQIVSSLARERGRILFEQWQDHLLEEGEFTPRAPIERPSEEEYDDYEDDWAER